MNPQRKTRVDHTAALVASALAAALAVLALIGWALHVELLKRFIPGQSAMNPLSACSLILASIALALLQREGAAGTWKRLGQLAAVVVLLIGAVKFVAIVAG